MSIHTRLTQLFKRNVAFEWAIEQLHTPAGYYLCQHTLVDQYPDLSSQEKIRLLSKINELAEQTPSFSTPVTRQDWRRLERRLSRKM
ncbi:hypothetical protein [Exiguobacterium acetylicum]|uniref:hypothetical protein n=1 Tax=Exiguobacterium acetylicum TaxID=41170 RepID=UPI001EE1EEF7|nr:MULTISPECIES: hypothetical protein [Exiguobacterium]MCY1689647.1 hypothetical protein [Exiguobacterium sp. SL14]UKS55953.1 hypothetical protein K6T22_15725 [Exiguobacterium acetylicum]